MKEKPNKQPRVNIPRPSLTWLYLVILIGLIYLFFSSEGGSASKEVAYTEFKEMISKGYASKIVAYDNNTVDMYLKPEHIVDVFKKDAKDVGRSPIVNVQIGSIEALDKFLDEQTEKGNFKGEIKYDKKGDYFGTIFWNIAPLLFFVALWFFLIRRMSGGGGGGAPGNVFNVGKAKRSCLKKELTALLLKM